MIKRRQFLKMTVATPLLGFIPRGQRSLPLPEPPYPYAFGETYSEAGIELQVTLDPYGGAWETIQHLKVGEIYHVEEMMGMAVKYLRMVVTNVDLQGGVITLAGVQDGRDSKQLDPWAHGGEPWQG